MKKYTPVKAIMFLFLVSLMAGSCGFFGDSETAKFGNENEGLKNENETGKETDSGDEIFGEKSKQKVKLNSGSLMLRDAPNTETGNLVARIPNGAEVIVEGCKKDKVSIGGRSGSWCRAIYKGKGGWVFNAFLAAEEDSDSKPEKTQSGTPKFSDYAVNDVYAGKNHDLVLDEAGKQFKSRLEDTIKNGKPTFAGRYIVAKWGCGSGGCNTGAVIDAKTGRAYKFPVGLSSVSETGSDGVIIADHQEHEYKLNSRLMIFAGNLEGADLDDGSDTKAFYEFKDNKFVLIKSVPYGKSKK